MTSPFDFCARLDTQLGKLDAREAKLQTTVALLTEAFGVGELEVAIFVATNRLEQEVLKFIWPLHLANAASGYVSLSSGNSLAVQTFHENRPFINVTFASTPHAAFPEMLPVNKKSPQRPPPIQKIISAPLRHKGGFQGVIQVSHKGESLQQVAGNFAQDDMTLLALAAPVIASHL
ncbi:MAG: hypothetical protein C0621_07175 [Desulfuromonas sp.]|nr:MAG: hypothetical protein C0621_07175 [Desulfuromonas sp.]